MKFRIRPWGSVTVAHRSISLRFRYAMAILVGITALLISLVPYHSDDALSATAPVQPLSLGEAMRGIPPTSPKTLAEQYGIQISQVTVTALNGVVDARLKVLDSEKADQLLGYQGALLVGDTLIPAPYMHRHALKQGLYVVFYPNQQQTVRSGTPVSLVFGTIRSEPIVAQ